ncbi:MAG: response regulator, partial [Deltaproteobacteria bacterium]|nr:response regulator [Deltaproteobacteria bacterium]
MSRILLVADDSKTMQKVVQITFDRTDYEVVVVDDGNAAVQKAREVQPAVVLLDAVMPGLSGYDACQTLKQDPATAGSKVLLLAGTHEPFDEGRATASGADGFITKPFETQALIDKVNLLVTGAKGEPMPSAIPGMAARPVVPAPAPVPPAAPAPAPAPAAPTFSPTPAAPAPAPAAPAAPSFAPTPAAPPAAPVPAPAA